MPDLEGGGSAPDADTALGRVVEELGGLVRQQAAQGGRLVEALAAQLAEGQVETLHSLQSASAMVRRHVVELRQSADAAARASASIAQAADAVADRLGRTVAEDLAARVSAVGEVVTESMSARLDADVDAVAGRLADLVSSWTQQLQESGERTAASVLDHLERAEVAMASASDGAASTAAAAQEALDGAAWQVATRLETATAAMDGQAAGITRSADALADRAQSLVDDVSRHLAAGGDAVTTAMAERLRADVDELAGRLADLVGSRAQELQESGERAAASVVDHLERAELVIAAASSAAAQQAAAAQEALDWAAAEVASRLETATVAMEAQTGLSEDALRSTGTHVAEQIRLMGMDIEARVATAVAGASEALLVAGDEAAAQVVAASDHAVAVADGAAQLVRVAAQELRAEVDRGTTVLAEAADAILQELSRMMRAQERRDRDAVARLQERAKQAEEALAGTAALLQEQLGRLHERDAGLEAQRASEFAAVLATILESSGGRAGRNLLARVRESLQSERRDHPTGPLDRSAEEL